MGRSPESLPESIGPYRVLRLLGEGGMGAVYEAEETGPVRRRVAVKVVRAWVNCAEVVARFNAERQALALMDHPGIAKVLQAGTAESGDPYFSMELVRGLPITNYCDAYRLSVAERVELFIAVCRAVQHAHQKGVVHRDLKPSNVLVSEQDGVRQPKIIDFGVAKAIGAQLTERGPVTLIGTAIGTAAYMSPEQAEASGMDVDTRSDIYSLGVMLFELLVGQLPMDPSDGGIHVFLARLASRQTSPPTPSARLNALGDSGAVAYTRHTDPRRLRRELQGDLDWIVTMAMHPDRTHRYATANGLAEDLQRHLNDEPVVARPPSTTYRLNKFVHRHRAGVIAASIVLAAVVGGGTLATIGFIRASRAEGRAHHEAEAARQVTDFLVKLFEDNDPGRTRGDTTLTAWAILARGAARVTTELAGQPLLQARLMQTLGEVHQNVGLYAQARALFDNAVQIRERELGPHDTLVASALRGVGEAARSKGDLKLADSAYSRSLSIREAAFGPVNIDVATSLALLASLRFSQRRLAEAESLYKKVLPLDEQLRTATDRGRARNLRGLGVVEYAQGRYAEAEVLFHRTLSLQEQALGKDHYDVGGTLNNLGGLYYSWGRYGEAMQYYQRAQPVLERSLGPTHNTVVGLHNNLGETYWKLKAYGKAEPLLRQVLATKDMALAPNNSSIGTTLHALAGVLRDEGRYGEAEPLYRRALAIRERTAATDPRLLVETLRDFAELLSRTGRASEGARLDARATQLQPAKK